MDKFKQYLKYIGIGGCIVALVGIFLPWISALGMSAPITNRLGIYLIIMLVASGALFFLESSFFALISTIFGIVWLTTNAITVFANGILVINPAIGVFVMYIGLIVALVAAIMMLINSKKEKTNGQL